MQKPFKHCILLSATHHVLLSCTMIRFGRCGAPRCTSHSALGFGWHGYNDCCARDAMFAICNGNGMQLNGEHSNSDQQFHMGA